MKKLNKPAFRIHFTCPVGHTSYWDVRTKKAVEKTTSWLSTEGWIVTKIEMIIF